MKTSLTNRLQRLQASIRRLQRARGRCSRDLLSAVDALWQETVSEPRLDALLAGVTESVASALPLRGVDLYLAQGEQARVAARWRGEKLELWPELERETPELESVRKHRQSYQAASSVVLPLWDGRRLVGHMRLFPEPGRQVERAVLERLTAPVATALHSAIRLQGRLDSERQLCRVGAQLPAIIWTTDRQLRITSGIGAGLVPLHWHAEEMVGKTLDEALGGAAEQDPLTLLSRRVLEGESVSRQGQRRDRFFETSIEPLRSEDGEIIGTLGVALDVTDQRRSEAALEKERTRATRILNAITDGVIAVDLEGTVRYINPAAERLLLLWRDEALDKPFEQIFHTITEDSGEPMPNPTAETLKSGVMREARPGTALLRADGSRVPIEDEAIPVPDPAGELAGVVVVFRDISNRRALLARIERAATHDALTGLPNRTLLVDRLERALAHAQRHRSRCAVLFLDLDRFKHINDSLGHDVGDKLLGKVAERLQAGVRRTDTVARHGGDEFVIVLDEIAGPAELAEFAETLAERIQRPYRIDAYDLHISASVGISVYPDDGQDRETLLKHADMAMYHAKQQGRNNFQFFLPEMNQRVHERLLLEEKLRRALARGELQLHYQPQINLRTGRWVGVEALLRWQPPDGAPISTASFIEIAEQSGLILPIGEWVLRESCRQARAWREAGLPPLRIAVNISAQQLDSKGIVETVQDILEETGLEPEALELELTETMIMQGGEATIQRMQALKELGVGLSIDDFGTGYSSLGYLKHLPVDQIKIDKGFVCHLPANKDDAAIAKAVIRMAHSLRLPVVAEGVESRESAAFLRANRCHFAQGYFFARPVDATRLASLLRAPG